MKSLVEKLRPSKLPETAYFVQDDDQVRKLTNLRYDDAANKRSCSCMQLCGDERVVDGRANFTNKITAPANRCFDRLLDAVEFIRIRRRTAEKNDLIRELRCSHGTQYRRMMAMRKYPNHVLNVLTMMELIPEDVKDVADLKTSHYRVAIQSEPTDLITAAVVSEMFPDLVDAADEHDE